MLISWKLNKCYFERGSEWKKFTFLPLFTSKGSLFLTRQLFAKMQGGEDFLFFICAVWMFGIVFLGVPSQVLEGIMVFCQASCFTLSMSFLNSSTLSTGKTDSVFGSYQSFVLCKSFLFCEACFVQKRIDSFMGTLRTHDAQTGLILKFTINQLYSRHPQYLCQIFI